MRRVIAPSWHPDAPTCGCGGDGLAERCDSCGGTDRVISLLNRISTSVEPFRAPL